MIILLAGTADARMAADCLIQNGYRVTATAVSEYGGGLAARSGAEVVVQALSLQELEGLIDGKGARAIVDCTHPYACNISVTAQTAAKNKQIPYIRYERPLTSTVMENIHRAKDWTEAAHMSAALGNVIFLTTGTRHLAEFLRHQILREKRIVARILPEPGAVAACRDLGMLPRDIIAMQGPFSADMNRILFAEYGAEVIVTKDAGEAGGTDAKLAAARELGIPVVVIDRPSVEYSHVVQSMAGMLELFAELGIKQHHEEAQR